MTRIVAVVMVLVLAGVLSGCNMSLGLGNFEFNKVHIDTYHHSKCFSVEKWYENGTGIEVKTKESGSMYFSEGTYILIADKCPFCDTSTEKGGGEE